MKAIGLGVGVAPLVICVCGWVRAFTASVTARFKWKGYKNDVIYLHPFVPQRLVWDYRPITAVPAFVLLTGLNYSQSQTCTAGELHHLRLMRSYLPKKNPGDMVTLSARGL